MANCQMLWVNCMIINMDSIFFLIFQFVALIFSIIIHEISHGAMALKLGDTTAKDAGRLTLNPLKHIDPIGSIILPLSLYLISAGGFILGWAKPVPYNPLNLKNPRSGAAFISIAGPLSNLILAAIFAIIIRIINPFAGLETVAPLLILFNVVVLINILLAIFNLLPIPPLDGASILFALLPSKYDNARRFLTQYGFYILIFFILFGFQLITPIIYWTYAFLVGHPLF